MKFICIFLCLLATAVALEAPESFLRGSDVNRDLRGNKILFTSGACQRELSVCEASLLKSDGWESVLASSGNAKIQAIAATSTDYESIVAGFAQLTTRERAQNAARVIPEITTSVAAIQKSEDTDDKKDSEGHRGNRRDHCKLRFVRRRDSLGDCHCHRNFNCRFHQWSCHRRCDIDRYICHNGYLLLLISTGKECKNDQFVPQRRWRMHG